MLFIHLELSTFSPTLQIPSLFWVLVRLHYHGEAFLSIPGHVIIYLSILKLLLFVLFSSGFIPNLDVGVLCCSLPPSEGMIPHLLLSVFYFLPFVRCWLQVYVFCSFTHYLFIYSTHSSNTYCVLHHGKQK